MGAKAGKMRRPAVPRRNCKTSNGNAARGTDMKGRWHSSCLRERYILKDGLNKYERSHAIRQTIDHDKKSANKG